MTLALPSRRAALMPGQWVGNALWRSAKAVPSLDLRFAESKSLVDSRTGQNLATFTRASSATYVGSDGLIKTATTNEPRFDHNPTTGESLGLLVEEQRTNLLLWSEEFDNAAWIKTRSTVSADLTAAPSGQLVAEKLVEDTQTGPHHVNRAVSFTSGLAYTLSGYYKAGERTRVQLQIGNGGSPFPVSANHLAVFNLSTGALVSSGSAVTASILAAGNGWYRCSITATAAATSTDTVFAGFIISSGTTSSYTGDGTSGIYIWGVQLEAGAFPTGYIPTTTAAVTRSADVANITTQGGSIRSLFAQFRSPASGTRPVVSLDDNTANERIEILTSGTDPKLLVTDGGSAVADLNGGTVTANVAARIAARFNTDNYAISINGGASQLDASGTLPTVDRVRIGSNQAGGYLNGTIARIAGWDTVLPSLPSITQ